MLIVYSWNFLGSTFRPQVTKSMESRPQVSRDNNIYSVVKWAALVTSAHKVHRVLQLACFCLPFPLSSIDSGASLLSDRHSALHHCCIHPPLHLLIPPSSSAFIPLGLQGILETSPQRRPPPCPELSMFCDPILRKSSLFRVPYFMPCAIHFLHSCSLAPRTAAA